MESTVSKGRGFEGQVADWLESALDHQIVKKNEWVEVSKAVKPFECDIHTKVSAPHWVKLQKAGAIAGFIFALLSYYNPQQAQLKTYCLIGLGVAVVAFIKRRQRDFHVWVECKNLRGRVNREHMIKLKETIVMLKEHDDAKWVPDYVLFFSATDYERDAIHFANRNNIECYRRAEGGFERAN